MIDHGCWTTEYDWVTLRPSNSEPAETVVTVLSVIFDSGAQRQFSSVRLTLLLSDVVANDKFRDFWQITPHPSPSPIGGPPTIQNDPTLPNYHIAFMVDQYHPLIYHNQGFGKIVLTQPPSGSTSAPCSSVKLFEFNHPLTEDTETVSFSFTSSFLLDTKIVRGVVRFVPSLHHLEPPGTVGRVVRVVPTSGRRTIPLPTDVLPFIFDHLPLTHEGWRQDVLNSALVCRDWTCALNLLLDDFRYLDGQLFSAGNLKGKPAEIIGFANKLVACPSLGLRIKFLSTTYFAHHPARESSSQNYSEFSQAFLSILRIAKNVKILFLSPGLTMFVSPKDLTDALWGLNNLDSLQVTCTGQLTVIHLLYCIARCPSLKTLSVSSNITLLMPRFFYVPLPSLSFHLTELRLTDLILLDDELACLANTSQSTLSRLTLFRVTHLTNAGLTAALNTVRTSLTFLEISESELRRDPEEERALDMTTPHMERLSSLKINLAMVTEQMLERRTEEFARRTTDGTPDLPEVELCLADLGPVRAQVLEDQGQLMSVIVRERPGWRFNTSICARRPAIKLPDDYYYLWRWVPGMKKPGTRKATMTGEPELQAEPTTVQ